MVRPEKISSARYAQGYQHAVVLRTRMNVITRAEHVQVTVQAELTLGAMHKLRWGTLLLVATVDILQPA